MKEKILKNRNLIDVAIIILVAIILGIPLLNSNTDIYHDDGIQHIARAYGTFLNMQKNDGIQNIISSFSNNFGYSWNLFYGPISCFGIIGINFITNNFLIAYKFFTIVCLMLSGYFMYKFISNFSRNNNVALLSGILYMTFPYHLTDLYIRNALGEFTSFVFIPLVFLGLYNLFYTTENHYYITIGAVGLILTHNISTIIVAFFALLYFVVNLPKIEETRVKKGLTFNVIFILLITSFFWIPFLEAQIVSRYQVYESGMMATSESVANHGLNITQLFVTKNDGSFVFELGPHMIIMLAFSLMAFRKMKPELKETYGFFLISGLLTLWMSTKYFPWKILPQELSFIQFPWRMLMMSAFFLSIVAALNMYILIKNFKFKDVAIISAISLCYIAFFVKFIPYSENVVNISECELGKISGREIEVSAGLGKEEYLPVNAYNNRFYIATRSDNIEIIEGKGVVNNEVKNGTHYTAQLQVLEADYAIFELPYIYYPGYEVRIDGMITNSFETPNGFVGFVMLKDDYGDLEVNYTGTNAMKISRMITILSSIIFAIYVLKKH